MKLTTCFLPCVLVLLPGCPALVAYGVGGGFGSTVSHESDVEFIPVAPDILAVIPRAPSRCTITTGERARTVLECVRSGDTVLCNPPGQDGFTVQLGRLDPPPPNPPLPPAPPPPPPPAPATQQEWQLICVLAE